VSEYESMTERLKFPFQKDITYNFNTKASTHLRYNHKDNKDKQGEAKVLITKNSSI